MSRIAGGSLPPSTSPVLNRVGIIQPGESRESGSLTDSTTCGFHDHNDPSDASLKGRIVVD